MTRVTLITKPDCHLCDVAREIVDTVVAEREPGEVEVAERSILHDRDLYDQWWEKIPVIVIDDTVHTYWRVSADRFRDALAVAARGNSAPDKTTPAADERTRGIGGR